MKRVLVLLLALFVASSTAVFAADMPKVGDKAPEFSLKSGEGTPVSLKDYKGKWVVLYFYPRNFTGGCTIEAHNFQRDLDKYTAANAVILGVSVDPATEGDRSQKLFCEKEGLHFKTLSDESMEVSQTYGSLMTMPANEKRGELKLSARNTFIIDPSGKIVKVFEKVNPEPHSEEVLATLAELQKKK
jgi:peroxiredoxin Q/BCP